jgi:hypothetical protein
VYKLVYSEEAVRQLLAVRSAPRRRTILKALDALASDPSRRGSAECVDDQGRKNQILVLPGVAITYWADHAACEMRIVDLTDFGF